MALRDQLQRSSSASESGEQTTVPTGFHPLGSDFISLIGKVGQHTGLTLDRSDAEAKPRRDYETAFGLLDQASKALDVLLNRCETLEAQLSQVSERARSDAAAAEAVTAQWQKLAGAMKAQVDEHEKRLAAMRQRAEAAEARLESVKQRASSAEQVAAEKEELSTRFHDKVVNIFGIGSRAHAVLDAVAKGTISDAAPSAVE